MPTEVQLGEGGLADRRLDSRDLTPRGSFGCTDFWPINRKQTFLFLTFRPYPVLLGGEMELDTDRHPASLGLGFSKGTVRESVRKGFWEIRVVVTRASTYEWEFYRAVTLGEGAEGARAPCPIHPQPFSSSCYAAQCRGPALPAAEGLRAAHQ